MDGVPCHVFGPCKEVDPSFHKRLPRLYKVNHLQPDCHIVRRPGHHNNEPVALASVLELPADQHFVKLCPAQLNTA
jgi:hypothetical protein